MEGSVRRWMPLSIQATSTCLYKSVYVNLNDDLNAESERKPAAWREGQRKGESARMDTGTMASHAREET